MFAVTMLVKCPLKIHLIRLLKKMKLLLIVKQCLITLESRWQANSWCSSSHATVEQFRKVSHTLLNKCFQKYSVDINLKLPVLGTCVYNRYYMYKWDQTENIILEGKKALNWYYSFHFLILEGSFLFNVQREMEKKVWELNATTRRARLV